MAEAKAPGGTLSHAELSRVAVRWLKRNRGAGGPGCHIAMSETKSGWGGEIPDAIGFKQSIPHIEPRRVTQFEYDTEWFPAKSE